MLVRMNWGDFDLWKTLKWTKWVANAFNDQFGKYSIMNMLSWVDNMFSTMIFIVDIKNLFSLMETLSSDIVGG